MISIMTRSSTANHLTRPKKRGRGRKNIGENYGTRKPSHDDNNSMTKHDRPPFFHFSRPNRFVNRPSESSTQRSGNVGEKVASLEERSMARPPLLLFDYLKSDSDPLTKCPVRFEGSELPFVVASRSIGSAASEFRTEYVGTRQLLHPSRFNEPDRFHRSAARAAPAEERGGEGRED